MTRTHLKKNSANAGRRSNRNTATPKPKALRLELKSNAPITPSEDAAKHDLLLTQLIEEWSPRTSLEHERVKQLAHQISALRRAAIFETEAIALACQDIPPEEAETEDELRTRELRPMAERYLTPAGPMLPRPQRQRMQSPKPQRRRSVQPSAPKGPLALR